MYSIKFLLKTFMLEGGGGEGRKRRWKYDVKTREEEATMTVYTVLKYAVRWARKTMANY